MLKLAPLIPELRTAAEQTAALNLELNLGGLVGMDRRYIQYYPQSPYQSSSE